MTARLWRPLGTSIVLVLGGRLCYLVLRYQHGGGAVKRPHIETAALLLAIAGLIVRFATDLAEPSTASPTRSRIFLWLGLLAGALVLYWPALHVGLLSDDFILYQHALSWDVSQVAPQLFRPLPLFVWAVVLHLGGGPTGLHLLNILIHGTNAYLAGRIVAGWVPGRWWPTLAALLVLAAPLGPEAVVWCSGTFDLFATMFMLSAILVARRTEQGSRTRLAVVAFTLAALLSKETAIVVPLLLALDGIVNRSTSRRFWVDAAMAAVFAVLFAAVRLPSATAVETNFSRYRVQRLMFDSFGTLAAPWHANDPWGASVRTVYALCVIVLIIVFFLNRGQRWASLAVLGGAAWVLASILPLLAFFYVGPQLEGSRYLYLAACGWAAILVTATADISVRLPRANALLRTMLIALIAAGAWGARQHIRPWTHAAAVRDTVLRAAAADPILHDCSPAYVEGLPDSVGGAYLFANGAREALADVGVTAYARRGTGTCAFQWDPDSSRFVPASAPVR